MPPQNEPNNDKKDTRSWFDSWFERDMFQDIHEQLNDFDKRKQQYEQEQEERRRFFQQQQQQQPSHAGFPFFLPPGTSQKRHQEELEDFLGGRIPQWPPPEFGGPPNHRHDDEEEGQRRRQKQKQKREDDFGGRSPFDNERQQESIEDLHREMQSLFEQAFAGGTMEPRGGWTSSSTVVSSSNGTSYTMKQDSKNGARVDLKLPKNSTTENISLEVLREEPCLIRWKNNDDLKERKRTNKNGQVLELGNFVDCSKLSASISEAHRTLTVKAPPKGKQSEEAQRLSLKPNSYPRPVRVTKKD